MSPQGFSLLALQLAAMLGSAVLFGALMRRIGQPVVLGEMLGGILLGPTILGALSPAFYGWLFQSSTDVAAVRDASVKLGMLFFMFIAGLQVNLSRVRQLGFQVGVIGLVSTLVPMGVGIGLVHLLPAQFWGPQASGHLLPFALFVGMNLANSANSVIARILMDLNLLRAEIGTFIMTATIVDDFVNWTVFAIILSQLPGAAASPPALATSIASVLAVFLVILGGGRWVAAPALRWVRSRVAWPTGFIAVTTLVILLASSLAEKAGAHAFLGAFLTGAALGNGGEEERNQAHDAMTHFALSFFAPLYFVSMGLNADFVSDFDWALVVAVLVVACVSKIGAVLLGARIAGMPVDRRAWAIGFGLNARGATGLVLAGVGLEYGLIDKRMFVALVVTALATTVLAVPALKRLAGAASPAHERRPPTG